VITLHNERTMPTYPLDTRNPKKSIAGSATSLITIQLQQDDKFMTDYCPVVKWRDMNETIFARRCDMISMRLGGKQCSRQGRCFDEEGVDR
jgi:hypothetical protein